MADLPSVWKNETAMPIEKSIMAAAGCHDNSP